MNLAIIGPSGSGKGTQAQLIAQKYHLTHISTGELFRKEYEAKSPEGLAAFAYWSVGHWVPDEETFSLLKLYLEKAQNGFVLDGYPRTVDQGKVLDFYLKEQNLKLDLVVNLVVSEDEVVKRLLLRAQKDKARKGASRKDETEKVIRQRMVSFKQSIKPILFYYESDQRLVEVNGVGKIEDIFTNIVAQIEKK